MDDYLAIQGLHYSRLGRFRSLPYPVGLKQLRQTKKDSFLVLTEVNFSDFPPGIVILTFDNFYFFSLAGTTWVCHQAGNGDGKIATYKASSRPENITDGRLMLSKRRSYVKFSIQGMDYRQGETVF